MKQATEQEFYDFMKQKDSFAIMDNPNGKPPHFMRYFNKITGEFLGGGMLYHDDPQSECYVPPAQRHYFIYEDDA